MHPVAMDVGRADRHPWRLYTAVVLAVFGGLIVTGTTMSSIGIAPLRASGDYRDAEGMVGTPRSIRSDEFARTSPWRIGALADPGVAFESPLVAEGDILTQIVNDGLVSRLVLYESLGVDAGRILPDSVAFALLWWTPSVMFWLLAPRLFAWFGMSRDVGIVTTALIFLSPAVMWWSLAPVASAASSVAAALLMLGGASRLSAARALPGRTRWSRGYLPAAAMCLAAGALLARVPFAYAPWAIVAVITVVGPAVAVAVQRVGLRSTAGAVALVALAAGAFLVAVIVEHRRSFSALTATGYPGSRRSTAQSLDLGAIFGAPHLGILRRATAFEGTNASEISSGFTLLAVPCVLYGFASIAKLRELSVAWWAHAGVLGVCFAWILVDLPAPIGSRVPLLSLTPPGRVAQVIGLCATAWFGITLMHLRLEGRQIRLRLAIGTAVVAIAVAATSGAALRLRLPELTPTTVLLTALVAGAVIGLGVLVPTTGWSVVPMVAAAAAIVVGANPLIVGLGDLRSSEAARTVTRLHRRSPGYWATNSVYLDALLMANAIPSISGQQFTGPERRAWRRLDPDESARGEWNRGVSSITFAWDTARSHPDIRATAPDIVTVTVSPCDPGLRSLGLRFVVSTVALDAPCLRPRKPVLWGGADRMLYAVSPP